MSPVLLLLSLLATSSADLGEPCQLHRYDRYDIRACTDLDYAVCAPNGVDRDQQILELYAELQLSAPQPSAECMRWWLLVQCSAAFHWSSTLPHVCPRTCDRFNRVCAPYGFAADDPICGRRVGVELPGSEEADEDAKLPRGSKCKDYASNTECRECTTAALENDSERVAWLRQRAYFLSNDAETTTTSVDVFKVAIVGFVWIAFVQ